MVLALSKKTNTSIHVFALLIYKINMFEKHRSHSDS